MYSTLSAIGSSFLDFFSPKRKVEAKVDLRRSCDYPVEREIQRSALARKEGSASPICTLFFFLLFGRLGGTQSPTFNSLALPPEFQFSVGQPFSLNLTDLADGQGYPVSVSVTGAPFLQTILGMSLKADILVGTGIIGGGGFQSPDAAFGAGQLWATRNATQIFSYDLDGNFLGSLSNTAAPLTAGGNTLALHTSTGIRFANITGPSTLQLGGELNQNIPGTFFPGGDTSIKLSNDGRWAYWTNTSGVLNIVDLNNLNNPTVNATVGGRDGTSGLTALAGPFAYTESTQFSMFGSLSETQGGAPIVTFNDAALSSPSALSAQPTASGSRVHLYNTAFREQFFDSAGNPMGPFSTRNLLSQMRLSSGAAVIAGDTNVISLYNPNGTLFDTFDVRDLYPGQTNQLTKYQISGNLLAVSALPINNPNLTISAHILLFQLFTGTLSGTPTSTGSGVITFTADNGFDTAVVQVPYTVTDGSNPNNSSSSGADNTGPIVGGVLGGVVCLLIVVIGGTTYYLLTRKKERQEDTESQVERSVRKYGVEGQLLNNRWAPAKIDPLARQEIRSQGGTLNEEDIFGRGAHSRVFAVVDTKDLPLQGEKRPEGNAPLWRAAKAVERGVKTGPRGVSNAYELSQNEQRLWELVQGEGVIPLIATFVDEELQYSVMPMIESIGLSGFPLIARIKDLQVRLRMLTGSLRDTLIGLKTMHDKNVVHGDLSPENVAFFRNGRVVITDFGRSVEGQMLKAKNQGTWYVYSYERLRAAFEDKACDGFADDLYGLALSHVAGWVGYDEQNQVGLGPWQIFQMPGKARELYQLGPDFIKNQIESLPRLEFLRKPKEGTLFWVMRGLLLGTITHEQALKAPCFEGYDPEEQQKGWNLARRGVKSKAPNTKEEAPLTLPTVSEATGSRGDSTYFGSERSQEDPSSSFYTVADEPLDEIKLATEKRESNYGADFSKQAPSFYSIEDQE
ncbi:MAG: hypothetical protein AB7F31_05900 [Parachlamydiales bacterium]